MLTAREVQQPIRINPANIPAPSFPASEEEHPQLQSLAIRAPNVERDFPTIF
jgi:hypothetical protein